MTESNLPRARGLVAAGMRRARKEREKLLQSEALISSLHGSTPEARDLADALSEIAIPAIDQQKQAKNQRPTLPSVPRPIMGRINQVPADLWKDCYFEFSKLSSEEAQIVQARMKDEYLKAYCTYKRETEVLHERGKSEQGPSCFLKMPEHGIWNVGSGVSENFQERFRTLAARAGLSLGCPDSSEPEDFWLHSLFHDLLDNGSELLFAEKRDEGGVILRECEASATFCTRLERKALAQPIPLRPLERLPLYKSDTGWALRFGAAGQIVKELRHILQTKKTQNTPELANRERKLIEFLWREHSTVAEELELPRINDLAKGARDTIHDMPRQGRRARAKPQGRPSHRAEGFVSLAASLWRGKITKGKIVTDAKLASVALDLDAAGYTPPAEFLEGQAARKLRTFNSSHANSRVNGPISTWVDLVQHRDKDFIRAMRRLLSRCASKCPETLSGQKKSSL